MSYTNPRLQFGDNEKRVPGHENDADLNNPTAPILNPIADLDSNIWNLVFSYAAGQFYLASATVPGLASGVINSWYQMQGEGPGKTHALTIIPFADGQFIQAANFIDFSEPPLNDNTIITDTIMNPTVSASMHYELPEFAKLTITNHATSHSVIITTEITSMVFDKFFVIYGGLPPVGNVLTVPKGESCLALAVYKSQTSKSTKEFSTYQWPRIPKWEWPQVIAEIVQAIAVKGNGEIWEYLSPRLLAEVEPDLLKRAVDEISVRIGELDNVKAMITSLVERR